MLPVTMSSFDIALSIALGIGLAAAVGFRIFLPLLVASAAAYTGHLQLSDSFAWLGSLSAVTMLGVAAIVEVLAYYIPAVDNLLDTITTPVALIAGTLVSAAVMVDLPPIVKWTTAIIAGGGAAGLNIVPIARRLDCRQVLVPRTAGALSACGGQYSNIVAEFSLSKFAFSGDFAYEEVNRTLEKIQGSINEFSNALRRKGLQRFATEYSSRPAMPTKCGNWTCDSLKAGSTALPTWKR